MRILVVTTQWFPDFAGGSARVATDTARHLALRGHEVTAIAPEHAGIPRQRREHGVEVVRMLPRNAFPETLLDVPAAWRAVWRRDADVVLVHHAPAAVGVLAARVDAPLVYVFHASAARELRFLRSRTPLGPRRLAQYPLEGALLAWERVTMRRAEKILVLSDYSRTLVRGDHPAEAEKVVRVPGGVDVEEFAPDEDARAGLGIPSDTTLLVTARRLEPRMGIDELLRALVGLRDVSLAVIGVGPSARALQRLADDLGVADRVSFLGRVSDRELRSWYAAGDLFVLPTAAYEGFGMVTAEALACGTPVVATPVGASPELLVPLDRRLVADGTDAGSLAAAIRQALRLGAQLRGRCRAYAVENFAWERAIEPWERELALAARADDPRPVAA